MANQEHVEILAKGVEVWNEWRAKHYDVLPELSGADLHRAKLNGVDLRFADSEFVND